MNTNPYEPPRTYSPPAYPPVGVVAANVTRTPFILAAVGAWLASAYWAGLTLLIGLDVAFGSGSVTTIVLPCVLIALYAVRGYQLMKGDGQAAQRILFLHGVGAIAAVMQMGSGGGIVVFLQAVKILIHLFGGVAAYFARRAAMAAPAYRA